MSDHIMAEALPGIRRRQEERACLLERKETKANLAERDKGSILALQKMHAAIAEAQMALNRETAVLQQRIQASADAALHQAQQQIEPDRTTLLEINVPTAARQAGNHFMHVMTSLDIAREHQQAASRFLDLLQQQLDDAAIKNLLKILEEDQESEALPIAVKKAWARIIWQLRQAIAEQETATLEEQKKITAEEYKKRRDEIDELVKLMGELAMQAQRIVAEQNEEMMKHLGTSNKINLHVFIIQEIDAAALVVLASLLHFVTEPWKQNKEGIVSHTFIGSLFLSIGVLEIIRVIYECRALHEDQKYLTKREYCIRLTSLIGGFPAALGCTDAFLKNACGLQTLGHLALDTLGKAMFPLAFTPGFISALLTLVDTAKKNI